MLDTKRTSEELLFLVRELAEKTSVGPWGYEKCTLGHPDNARNPIVSRPGGYVVRLFSEDATVEGLTSLAPPAQVAEANASLIALAPAVTPLLEAVVADANYIEHLESCMGADSEGVCGPCDDLGHEADASRATALRAVNAALPREV